MLGGYNMQPGNAIPRPLELERPISMLKAILDATADAILVVDQTARVVMFNETLRRAWRIPSDQVGGGDVGETLASVLPQVKHPEVLLERLRDQHQETNPGLPYRLEFLDGRTFEYDSHSQYLDGVVVGRVWSFRNVSQRLRAEEALRASENH